MISKKVFNADGDNKRFLSDFIIRSEQFTRVYNYIFDANGVEGDIDLSSGLFIRTLDAPTSEDLVTINYWDLVDNSIAFYVSPYAGSHVYIEVATTAEEFGDTLLQPTVARAELAAEEALLSSRVAEAEKMTADSYATEPEDVFVKEYTSVGDGTFTFVNTSEYSALHYSEKAAVHDPALKVSITGDTMTGDLGVPNLTVTGGVTTSTIIATGGITTSTIAADDITTDTLTIGGEAVSPFSPKNKLLNGNFKVWQEGFGGASYIGDAADMWYMAGTGFFDVTAIRNATDALWEGHTLHNCAATPTESKNVSVHIYNRIENVNLFKNKDVTLSLKHNAPVGNIIYVEFKQVSDTGVELWTSPPQVIGSADGTIRRDYLTVSLPDIPVAYLPEDSYFQVSIYPHYQSGEEVDIAMVQLEEGSTMTTFEDRSVGVELSLCQRYFRVDTLSNSGKQYMTSGATSVQGGSISFPPMRAAPLAIIKTTPTVVNCTVNSVVATETTLELLVNKSTGDGIYRAFGGIYHLSALL